MQVLAEKFPRTINYLKSIHQEQLVQDFTTEWAKEDNLRKIFLFPMYVKQNVKDNVLHELLGLEASLARFSEDIASVQPIQLQSEAHHIVDVPKGQYLLALWKGEVVLFHLSREMALILDCLSELLEQSRKIHEDLLAEQVLILALGLKLALTKEDIKLAVDKLLLLGLIPGNCLVKEATSQMPLAHLIAVDVSGDIFQLR